jgi:hypothetical protein
VPDNVREGVVKDTRRKVPQRKYRLSAQSARNGRRGTGGKGEKVR